MPTQQCSGQHYAGWCYLFLFRHPSCSLHFSFKSLSDWNVSIAMPLIHFSVTIHWRCPQQYSGVCLTDSVTLNRAGCCYINPHLPCFYTKRFLRNNASLLCLTLFRHWHWRRPQQCTGVLTCYLFLNFHCFPASGALPAFPNIGGGHSGGTGVCFSQLHQSVMLLPPGFANTALSSKNASLATTCTNTAVHWRCGCVLILWAFESDAFT